MEVMENVNINSRVDLEFTINTSASILFNRLSTPSGLAEWFADDVDVDGDYYTFYWDKSSSKAQMLSIKENKLIRFRWINDDYSYDPDCFFEFRISMHELTGELSLTVTEQLSEDDCEDTISLWNYQVGELKRLLGV
jgi:uncharacterized protein YndB with AHSA1/START domain